MALNPGARLGPYEIVSALGAGGMGEVYKARDTRLDRSVAIKIVSAAMRGRCCRCGVVALIVLAGACERSASLTPSVNKLTFLTRPGCVNTPTMGGRLNESLGRLGLASNY